MAKAKGMRLSALQKQSTNYASAKAELNFGKDEDGNDQVLNIEFMPDKMTVGWAQAFDHAVEQRQYGIAASLFFDIVTDWDLLDDDGEKIPLTEDVVDLIGFTAFLGIAGELGKSANQIEEMANSSKAGSKNRTSRKRK